MGDRTRQDDTDAGTGSAEPRKDGAEPRKDGASQASCPGGTGGRDSMRLRLRGMEAFLRPVALPDDVRAYVLDQYIHVCCQLDAYGALVGRRTPWPLSYVVGRLLAQDARLAPHAEALHRAYPGAAAAMPQEQRDAWDLEWRVVVQL